MCCVVIEEPGRERSRWIRTALASLAVFATLGAGAVLWEYGRRQGYGDSEVRGILFAIGGVHAAGTYWVRHRPRRADFRWRARLVVPGAVRPGLLGAWSWRALAIEAMAAAGFVGGGLVVAGGAAGEGGGSGIIWTALAAPLAVALAVAVFRKLRRSGCVVLTAQGVGARGRFVRWEDIRAVRHHKDGVDLRLRSSQARPRLLHIDGPQCNIADERLVQVVDFYLANPQCRLALDTGPEQLALIPFE
jgi:hypothetical protein